MRRQTRNNCSKNWYNAKYPTRFTLFCHRLPWNAGAHDGLAKSAELAPDRQVVVDYFRIGEFFKRSIEYYGFQQLLFLPLF